jgi:hypothetical protein
LKDRGLGTSRKNPVIAKELAKCGNLGLPGFKTNQFQEKIFYQLSCSKRDLRMTILKELAQ